MRTSRYQVGLFYLLLMALPAILTSSTLQRQEVEMPHGQRDWSNIGAQEVTHGLADMAELAARLGSPVSFNREGYVVFIETFEHGLQGWATLPVGDDSSLICSAVWSRYGGYSAKLTAGSSASRYTMLYRSFPYPSLGKYGVEHSFKFDGSCRRIDFDVWVYKGKYLIVYGIRYDPVNDVLQYRKDTDSYITFVSDLELYTGPYSTLKLVFDLENDIYERCILNDVEYDMTDYLPQSDSITSPARLQLRITNWGLAATNSVAYTDDIIITQGEP